MSRPGSYAMAWPQRGLGWLPVVVRKVQFGVAGSHSHMSCRGTPFAATCGFIIPPNKTARLRLLSQTKAESYRALGARAGVSWVHAPVPGLRSQVSANASEMPVPSYEAPGPGRWSGSA